MPFPAGRGHAVTLTKSASLHKMAVDVGNKQLEKTACIHISPLISQFIERMRHKQWMQVCMQKTAHFTQSKPSQHEQTGNDFI